MNQFLREELTEILKDAVPSKDLIGNVSSSVEGVADVLTSMVGEHAEHDGRLYACADLLRRLAADLDAAYLEVNTQA